MSDVNVTIEAAPVSIEVTAAPIGVNIAAAPLEINVESAPIVTNIGAAPISIVVSGLRGQRGESDLAAAWFYLASSWTTEPVLNGTTPVLGGAVYDYTYGPTTYYRHVPSLYNPSEDAFYDTYSGGNLSGQIAVKGIAI